MSAPLTINNAVNYGNSQDYFYLRRLGMKYIEELGSNFWTDYNIHDPGVTLLEALCYAITDLGYRTSYSVADLIATPEGEPFEPHKQALFTPRTILTVNPWTVDDYRKALIDLDGIKNAWLFCKKCPCGDIYLYVDCKNEKLAYKPVKNDAHQVIIKGMYDVLIEFEDSNEFGDLNSGKLYTNISFAGKDVVSSQKFLGSLEVRFPSWQTIEEQLTKFQPLFSTSGIITAVHVTSISGNKTDRVDIADEHLYQELNEPLYACFTIDCLTDSGDPTSAAQVLLDNVPIRVWLKGMQARQQITVQDLRMVLGNMDEGGLVAQFVAKIKTARTVVSLARHKLHNCRNLAEDWCGITAVSVEDVSVCMDLEVTPDADIEQVLATAYFLIGRYFSPDVGFHSLKELLNSGVPVDEIFNGPALDHGFIDDEELEATNIKTTLYASDLIDILMDIPGVSAVRNLTMVGYDRDGTRVKAESWTYQVAFQHQPRLYMQGSKILVFKNGLPFLPDSSELNDGLQMLKGANTQQGYDGAVLDIPILKGRFKNADIYFPVQYQLPKTYGVSQAGLNPEASPLRKAQAKQLSAFMLMFEQLFVNYLSQLRNIGNLFSIDPALTQTYYSSLINNAVLTNADKLIHSDLSISALQDLMEDEDTMLDRRNRFLDHLLARFAESFSDYALMLFSATNNRKKSQARLIEDKIRFIEDYPAMSHNRAKSFNYRNSASVCSHDNVAGLKTRIENLLGLKKTSELFEFYEEKDDDGKVYETRWRLKNDEGKIILSGSTRYVDSDKKISQALAQKEIDLVLGHILNPENYTVEKDKKWTLNLTDGKGEVIGTRKHAFKTKADAEAARKEIIDFAAEKIMSEKVHIVEHVLLRPRNKPSAQFPLGDPLLPICPDKDCQPCIDDDPYSHRITIVLSGESGFTEDNMAFRRFAEHTIRLETPAHLGVKICWVSTAQMITFNNLYCQWLAELSVEVPEALALHEKLKALLNEFNHLISVYPDAFLHDCADGNDENRVFLDHTIV